MVSFWVNKFEVRQVIYDPVGDYGSASFDYVDVTNVRSLTALARTFLFDRQEINNPDDRGMLLIDTGVEVCINTFTLETWNQVRFGEKCILMLVDNSGDITFCESKPEYGPKLVEGWRQRDNLMKALNKEIAAKYRDAILLGEDL